MYVVIGYLFHLKSVGGNQLTMAHAACRITDETIFADASEASLLVDTLSSEATIIVLIFALITI